MILHINSYPGTGKLTIAAELAPMLGAKLLDNHSIYNIARALTAPKSDSYYQTLRDTRAIAFARILELPPKTPVIITNAHFQDSEWGRENWDAVSTLAKHRRSALLNIILACDPDEHDRRVQSADRAAKRKPRDPSQLPGNRLKRPLLNHGGDDTLHLDTTSLTASQSAKAIYRWLTERAP